MKILVSLEEKDRKEKRSKEIGPRYKSEKNLEAVKIGSQGVHTCNVNGFHE